MKLQRNSNYVLRKILDKYLLMPLNEEIGKADPMLLNDLSAFVWESMSEPISEGELLSKILDEYEVSYEVASTDLK